MKDGRPAAAAFAATEFANSVKVAGGDASILDLPTKGLIGNTHFMFADTNNKEVAALLSAYLEQKKLDTKK